MSWSAGLVVIAVELVRGTLEDLYMVVRGYPVPFFVGFFIVHPCIIVTGVVFTRRVQAEVAWIDAVGRVYPWQ